jgi:glucosylceramidase
MAPLSLQNHANGVALWNVALDPNYGRHLGGCVGCVPLVTIDSTIDGQGNVTWASVTKLNNFYQFGQLSKFMKVGATRERLHGQRTRIVTAVVKNPTGEEVLVATNINASSTTFTVTWNPRLQRPHCHRGRSPAYATSSRATSTLRTNVTRRAL